MTTLARNFGAHGATGGQPVASLPDGAHVLVTRLREECERQVPFSQAKLLLREAAAMIERLEAEVVRVTAELAGERAGRQAL